MTVKELANIVAMAYLNENPHVGDCPTLTDLDYLFFHEVGELTSDKLRLIAEAMDELDNSWYFYRHEWWRLEKDCRDELEHQRSLMGEI